MKPNTDNISIKVDEINSFIKGKKSQIEPKT